MRFCYTQFILSSIIQCVITMVLIFLISQPLKGHAYSRADPFFKEALIASACFCPTGIVSLFYSAEVHTLYYIPHTIIVLYKNYYKIVLNKMSTYKRLNIECVVCHVTVNICHVTGNICHVTVNICSLVLSSPQTPKMIAVLQSLVPCVDLRVLLLAFANKHLTDKL